MRPVSDPKELATSELMDLAQAWFLDNSNHDIGCELSPGQSASKLVRAALSSRIWRAVASATHAHELFATIS
jgi:hypothetical protein